MPLRVRSVCGHPLGLGAIGPAGRDGCFVAVIDLDSLEQPVVGQRRQKVLPYP